MCKLALQSTNSISICQIEFVIFYYAGSRIPWLKESRTQGLPRVGQPFPARQEMPFHTNGSSYTNVGTLPCAQCQVPLVQSHRFTCPRCGMRPLCLAHSQGHCLPEGVREAYLPIQPRGPRRPTRRFHARPPNEFSLVFGTGGTVPSSRTPVTDEKLQRGYGLPRYGGR